MSKAALNNSQTKFLMAIGLSPQAINLYKLILEHGPLTAQQAASVTYDFPSAHYRLFYHLEDYDLIRRLNARPQKFAAIPPGTGLWAAFVHKQTELAFLLKQTGSVKKTMVSAGAHLLELVVGRREIDNKYIALATEAKNEILVYAIGIAFSDILLETQLKAVKRAVKIRHIVQQASPQNYHIIHKWRLAGVEVRHLPAERGLHFYIIDRNRIVIVISDPDDTDSRLGILTDSMAAINLFVSIFEQLWREAKEIKW